MLKVQFPRYFYRQNVWSRDTVSEEVKEREIDNTHTMPPITLASVYLFVHSFQLN